MKCGANGTGYRFTNKAVNENERRLIQNYWIEMTQLYGTYTDFYTYDYSTSAHDFFYGEHPLAPFSGPTPMVMLAQFNNDSLFFVSLFPSDVVLLTSSFVVVFFLGSSVFGLSSAGFVFVRYELLT